MKAGKIIEYLKQFNADDDISILINIEVPGSVPLEDVVLSNARLALDDRPDIEPLVFNTRPAKTRIFTD